MTRKASGRTLRPVYRYGDLLDLFQAQRKRLAVRIDLGEIKLDDAMVEYAQMRVALTEEERRRNNETAMMAAQVSLQQQAVNAQTAATIAPMLRMQPIPPNPMPQWQPSPVTQMPVQTVP